MTTKLFSPATWLGVLLVLTIGGLACASTPSHGSKAGSEKSAKASTEKAKPGEPNIARSQFTSRVEDREPIDELQKIPNSRERIYFFTELRDFVGQTVTHRWEWNGRVMGEVPFTVRGPRWRVWSSKNLAPRWLGTWKVTVLDEKGNLLQTETFVLEESGESQTAESDQDEDFAGTMGPQGDENTPQTLPASPAGTF